ncbi:MAG: tRNA epoxyqueuosine(34) reductase QueG [Acidobacteriota bacterium]
MRSAALAERLKSRGVELGLGAVGIAAVEASDHRRFFERWLAAGHAGSMSWMGRTAGVRVVPRSRFPWARTAIVGAVSYLPYRGVRREQPGLLRHIARYALGRDYHRVLGARLRALAGFLESEAPGARTRVYVDTGPLLERELAARAGLGWFGKNANLIGPRGDSWLLLGQILTDVELPRDRPVPDHCGTCTACIDACPTGAILEPYLIDSNRCISYLTIEARGTLARERREALGEWVFGCDVCQEVCPWNRKVEVTADGDFLPGPRLRDGGLADLIRLDPPGFRSRLGGTPLDRPRRQGVVRNALIVAANTGDGPGLDAAEDRLADRDPVVRSAAAWALGRAGGGKRRRLLEAARAAEPDPAVRGEIETAIES